MNRIKSILVIAERSGEVAGALQKACIVARHFGATIELFACDAEHAYMAEHAYDRRGVSDAVARCLADSRRFLEAIRSSIAAQDLEIRTSVACETPLHAGIQRKVRELSPDLVIRCVEPRGGRRHSVLTSTDWQLLRSCPAPLMMTRGRTWHPTPRILAGVDVFGSREAAERVLAAAAYLSAGCEGDLELVYSTAAAVAPHARHALVSLAEERGLHSQARVEVLCGAPEETLAALALREQSDVLVLGALSASAPAEAARAGAVGTLTERLIERLDCDFLLVRHGESAALVDAALRQQTEMPVSGAAGPAT